MTTDCPDVFQTPWPRLADMQRRMAGIDQHVADLRKQIQDRDTYIAKLERKLATAQHQQQSVLGSREMWR